MKKGIFKAITLATLCLSMASCGMGTSGSSTSANLGGTASTGTHANGSLAGGLLGSALTGNTGGAGQLLNVLTGLLEPRHQKAVWWVHGPIQHPRWCLRARASWPN